MNHKDITEVACKKCGRTNEVPTYINVGRYTKWSWLCKWCYEMHTFDLYYGCQTMEEALMKTFKI